MTAEVIASRAEISQELGELAESMKHSAGTYMVPGWDGWKVSELLNRARVELRRTGLTPMGWVIDAATDGELAAYDDGCNGMMAALKRILDGEDKGEGVANEPWESLRRRVIALVAASCVRSADDEQEGSA